MAAIGSVSETSVATAAAAKRRVFASARPLVFCAVAVYALVLAGAGTFHFLAFQSAHLDLGTMTQAVWSTAHGHFLEMTDANGQNVMRFAYHVDPMLALLTPLWFIWPSGLMLVTVQAVAVASGAIPVYWLARKHLHTERAAAHFAFAYLLFPATQFNAFTISSGFHSVALAVPLLLFAIWYLDERRLVPFAILALLAVTTKEEIGATIGCLGIWYAVRHGERLVGAAILVCGFAISLFDFLVVIPHYSTNGANPFAGRYAQIGTTPSGVVHTALTNPSAIVHDLATGHKLLYVVMLLGPFLGLFLREPLLFLGAVPDLAINLPSNAIDQTSIAYHWTAGIIPFVFAATIVGIGRMRRDPDRLSLWVLAGAASISLFSPVVLARGDVASVLSPSTVDSSKAAALKVVPAGVPVTASNQLGTYLAARRYSYTLPLVGKATWAVIDPKDPTYADASGYRAFIRKLDRNPQWRRVFSSDGIEVLHKVGGAR
ncbi:MAG TPA: DUF2079 domain-containing protein [Gaiellaceae bacterium]|jgi:uncharacterized membrane protein